MAKIVVRVVLIELLSRLWFEVPESMGTREDVQRKERVRRKEEGKGWDVEKKGHSWSHVASCHA